jgi:lysozyme family protein
MTPQQTRQQLFDSMIIKPELNNIIEKKTSSMIDNKDIYQAIADAVNKDMPWYCVAVIHELECNQDFYKYLGNGQDLSKVTTIVPKGRGPFIDFESGAIDALNQVAFDKMSDWSLGHLLSMIEGYNGFGYEVYHNMPSPYLWAGTQFYVKGKYTSDGHFDPATVSSQIGVALLLKKLIN